MLEIHRTAIECCRRIAPIAEAVARRDRSLADQLRRASASVAMNIAEGCGSNGRNAHARFWNALGSAREVDTALELAVAFGYVEAVDAELVDSLDKVRATLWRVMHPRR
jgi:four helix bundle protein